MGNITNVERERRKEVARKASEEKRLKKIKFVEEKLDKMKETVVETNLKAQDSTYVRIAPLLVASTIGSYKNEDGDEIINSIINLNMVCSISKNTDEPLLDGYQFYNIDFTFTDDNEISWNYPDRLIRDSDYMMLVSKFKIDY